MSLARYLPNTRETPEETKRRVWRTAGMVVVNIDSDEMPWDMREWLKQWAARRFGPRRITDL